MERPLLRPLPPIPYEICEWVYGRKVNLNCHVIYRKNHYSACHRHVGRKVDLRITDTILEIYHEGARIATHTVFPSYVENAYATRQEDMPDGLTRLEWDDARIVNWAGNIGENTDAVIGRIFASVKVKEQAYNPCLSVLRLAKKYSPERLETTCGVALEKIRTPRYRHLKQILETNQDKLRNAGDTVIPSEERGGYVRGADYYGGERR